MTLRERSFGASTISARFLVGLAIAMWSFAPWICTASAHDEIDHQHLASPHHHHGNGSGDRGLDHCCATLASGLVATSVSAPLPNVKVALISLAAAAAMILHAFAPSLMLAPTNAATGPPRSQPTRFSTYSPLAPPAECI